MPSIIYCNGTSATYICANPICHSRMKHIIINFHFIRDQVAKKELCVAHVHTSDQLIDSLTKPLTCATFQAWCYQQNPNLVGT